jgi:hypothetical protein
VSGSQPSPITSESDVRVQVWRADTATGPPLMRRFGRVALRPACRSSGWRYSPAGSCCAQCRVKAHQRVLRCRLAARGAPEPYFRAPQVRELVERRCRTSEDPKISGERVAGCDGSAGGDVLRRLADASRIYSARPPPSSAPPRRPPRPTRLVATPTSTPVSWSRTRRRTPTRSSPRPRRSPTSSCRRPRPRPSVAASPRSVRSTS